MNTTNTIQSVNPARRLHTFLNAFHSYGNHSHSALGALTTLFSVDGNQREFLRREIWRASRLPDKSMRALVHAVGEEDAKVICRWEPQLSSFFNNLCLDAQIQNLVPYLDENTMHSVFACAAFLSREESRDGVQELLHSVDELRSEAEEAELPDDLLAFVKNRLRDIEMAVGDYCHGVAESSEIVSVWWRTQQKIIEMKKVKRPAKAVKNAIAVLGKLVVVANAAAGLWEKTQPMLPALTSTAEAVKLLPP